MKLFKRVLKWTGALLGIWLLAGIFLIGWGIYREPIAKKEATDFCAAVKVGQSIGDIAECAIASGAKAWLAKWSVPSDGVRSMHVTYIGMPPFSRHMCVIKATTSVVSAEYQHMD
jgi:hypothetical protein